MAQDSTFREIGVGIGAGIDKADRARRMRLFATGLLLTMAALFLALHRLHGLFPAWDTPLGYAIAFTEAAMVGGMADWFAVTALFRRPLGLPIPHTAIIPENKDRIADSMARFLRENFLTPQVVARRLQGFNFAASLGGFLGDPTRGENPRIRAGAANLLADVLESLDPEQMGGMVKTGLKSQLARIDAAPLLAQMLENAIADQRHLPVLEAMLRKVGEVIEANEPMIREMIHARANTIMRWTGLDERLANGVLDGTYRLLAEIIVQPDHPLRGKVDEALTALVRDLRSDPEMQARVARIKAELLANPALGAWIEAMWERGRTALLEAMRNPEAALSSSLGATLGQGLGQLGAALGGDARLQVMVNRFARRTLVGVSARYGSEIVRLVSETVKRWDAQTVSARIEGAVGRDLQFIRINGTLVGGLFGLAIHTVERFL
ncbi:membrane protein [Novosphingobium sp. MBES04]|nr:membrane protein [Novosphingobium sp. MBES04]